MLPTAPDRLPLNGKCALAIANCQSQIASIGPEDKLPFGSVNPTKSLGPLASLEPEFMEPEFALSVRYRPATRPFVSVWKRDKPICDPMEAFAVAFSPAGHLD
jgi:hypothetical protein